MFYGYLPEVCDISNLKHVNWAECTGSSWVTLHDLISNESNSIQADKKLDRVTKSEDETFSRFTIQIYTFII